ncbi:DUF1428 domain-containing protein [Hoeflea olei]|uniref:RNA signal recognition particle n=1 Tax=Hoeflea olei TaxID=1480615 RepID=A0A1C1YR59_9HYPH|nr:DUF1428 domain-containing protein [Hoeflea olei]OCW55860.1 RNA signal recognition particle [Hoeflea olei]
MTYVNGFLLPVPKANKATYTEMAKAAARIFRAHGALSVVENWGVDVPDGTHTSFPMAVKLEEGEAVVFSWTTWPDKATADSGLAAAMPELDDMMKTHGVMEMLDGKRMIFGGFETIVSD